MSQCYTQGGGGLGQKRKIRKIFNSYNFQRDLGLSSDPATWNFFQIRLEILSSFFGTTTITNLLCLSKKTQKKIKPMVLGAIQCFDTKTQLAVAECLFQGDYLSDMPPSTGGTKKRKRDWENEEEANPAENSQRDFHPLRISSGI